MESDYCEHGVCNCVLRRNVRNNQKENPESRGRRKTTTTRTSGIRTIKAGKPTWTKIGDRLKSNKPGSPGSCSMGGIGRSQIAHRTRNIDEVDNGHFKLEHQKQLSQSFAADIRPKQKTTSLDVRSKLYGKKQTPSPPTPEQLLLCTPNLYGQNGVGGGRERPRSATLACGRACYRCWSRWDLDW